MVFSSQVVVCHIGHPRLTEASIRKPSKLISLSDVELCQRLRKAHAQTCVTRNVLHNEHNDLYSYNQVEYVSKKRDKETSLIADSKSSVDKVLMYLEEKGYPYIVLKSNFAGSVSFKCAVSNSDTMFSEGNELDDALNNMSEDDMSDMINVAAEHHTALNTQPHQDLLLSVALTTPEEISLLPLYPEVLYVDCVGVTNTNKLPLLSITGKTCLGRMFTILRAYLPNERSWVFRWVFSTVLPKVFPRYLRNSVKVIISDGDAQEFTQLNCGIKAFFPKCRRLRCG